MNNSRRSSADGLKSNVFAAILRKETPNNELNNEMREEKNCLLVINENNFQKQNVDKSLSIQTDNTSIDSGSKKSIHSSQITLNDTKEYYKTVGIRWLRAIRKCEIEIIKKLLEEKPELVHYSPLYGPNALHIACAKSNQSIIKLLISNGVDINVRNTAGYTCLQLAVLSENISLVYFLIAQGANIDAIDPDGFEIDSYENWKKIDEQIVSKISSDNGIVRRKALRSMMNGRNPTSTPDASWTDNPETPPAELKRDSSTRSSWKSTATAFYDKNVKGLFLNSKQ